MSLRTGCRVVNVYCFRAVSVKEQALWLLDKDLSEDMTSMYDTANPSCDKLSQASQLLLKDTTRKYLHVRDCIAQLVSSGSLGLLATKGGIA